VAATAITIFHPTRLGTPGFANAGGIDRSRSQAPAVVPIGLRCSIGETTITEKEVVIAEPPSSRLQFDPATCSMARHCGDSGLPHHPPRLPHVRIYSKYLALQIKALEQGLLEQQMQDVRWKGQRIGFRELLSENRKDSVPLRAAGKNHANSQTRQENFLYFDHPHCG
jgi:hypothetical protein